MFYISHIDGGDDIVYCDTISDDSLKAGFIYAVGGIVGFR